MFSSYKNVDRTTHLVTSIRSIANFSRFVTVSLIFTIGLAIVASTALVVTSGPLYAGSAAVVGSDHTWSNTGNATGNTTSTAAVVGAGGSWTSESLVLTNSGFGLGTIIPGSAITGPDKFNNVTFGGECASTTHIFGANMEVGGIVTINGNNILIWKEMC